MFFFDHDKGKTHSSGKLLFNCRIIPGRGSWLDFEFDPKDILYFRIDRKKKLPITTILYALGFNKEKIIKTFYSTNKFSFDDNNKKWLTNFDSNNYKRPLKLSFDLIDAKNNKKILSKGEKLNIVIAKKLEEKGLKDILVSHEELKAKYISKDLLDSNKNIILTAGNDLNDESLEKINLEKIKTLELVNIDPINKGPYLLETLKIDKNLLTM